MHTKISQIMVFSEALTYLEIFTNTTLPTCGLSYRYKKKNWKGEQPDLEMETVSKKNDAVIVSWSILTQH